MLTLIDKIFMKSTYKQNLRAKWWWQMGKFNRNVTPLIFLCPEFVLPVFYFFLNLYFKKKSNSPNIEE